MHSWRTVHDVGPTFLVNDPAFFCWDLSCITLSLYSSNCVFFHSLFDTSDGGRVCKLHYWTWEYSAQLCCFMHCDRKWWSQKTSREDGFARCLLLNGDFLKTCFMFSSFSTMSTTTVEDLTCSHRLYGAATDRCGRSYAITPYKHIGFIKGKVRVIWSGVGS